MTAQQAFDAAQLPTGTTVYGMDTTTLALECGPAYADWVHAQMRGNQQDTNTAARRLRMAQIELGNRHE